LACNLGSLICGAWLPWATELFNFSGWFWMSLMMKTSELSLRLPGSFFYAPSPTLPDFVIYYGSLVAVLTGFAFVPKRRVWVCLGLAAISGFYVWRWSEARDTTEITVLPLNGGCAVYSDSPGRQNDLLVDCGNVNTVEFVMKPYLRAHGLNRLPRLALTHGDLRSVGGTEFLQELMPVEQIITSPARFRSSSYRGIIQSLQEDPNRWRKVDAGDHIGFWTVLHPGSAHQFPHADDNTLVLRGQFQGTRILLLSELGRLGQEALLQEQTSLRADIVVAGLPEQGEPLRTALLEAIQPKLIVIADSEYPIPKRANPALRERLAQSGVPVVYTRDVGAVTIQLRRDRCRVIIAGTNRNFQLAIEKSESIQRQTDRDVEPR
jgi:competence protein ComEC